MADSPSDAVELPLFELPLVLLPGELVPLHIFEERYKRMIGHSLAEEQPFGVVFRDDEGGARRIGCEARVTEVTEQFEDGRLNIVVTGERPFRVLDRFDAGEYPAGEVEPLEAPPAGEAGEAAARARAAYGELVERVGGEAPDTAELEALGAYAIAARASSRSRPSSTCSSCAQNRSACRCSPPRSRRS